MLLMPEQLGMLLRNHPKRAIVCLGAARLHWLFYDQLKDSADRAILWAYSRESRLIDVQILDQHVRRYDGADAGPCSLAELVQRYTGAELASHADINKRLTDAWPTLIRSPNKDLLDLVGQAATILLDVYEKLRDEAERILAAIAAARSPAPSPTSPANQTESDKALTEQVRQFWAEKQRAVGESGEVEQQQTLPSAGEGYGLLGVGVDVQGAVALYRVSRDPPSIDPERLDAIKTEGARLYRRASARLDGDHAARRCFRFDSQHVVKQDDRGEPATYPDLLAGWLEDLASRFVDLHGWPATTSIPKTEDGQLSLAPEHWSFWAHCDRGLAAYSDLRSAAGMTLVGDEGPWPSYEVVPLLRSSAPGLGFVRKALGPVLRPRPDHVFLVVTPSELRLRCFAAICRYHFYALNGRLFNYVLHEEDPVGLVAAELFSRSGSAIEPNPTRGFEPIGSVEHGVDAFHDPECTSASIRKSWHLEAKALLDALPLGLASAALCVYLDLAHDLVLDETTLMRRVECLVEEIAYELKGYLDDDILTRIATYLGLPVIELLRRLNLHEEDIGAFYAALRNDLVERSPRSAAPRVLWTIIQSSTHGESWAQVTERMMRYAAKTLAGRPTPVGHTAEVRRYQYLYAVDEVIKAMAYNVVAAGYRLMAVDDTSLVVEIEARAARENEAVVVELAEEAARPLLGPMTPPCKMSTAYSW